MDRITVRQTFSRIEKFADTMTHGIGLFLSVAAFGMLIVKGAFSENMWKMLSFNIYGLSLVSAYFSSTMYHLYVYYHPVPNFKFRRLLLIFDHVSIFFLIAGTYTPILLVFMRTKMGWTLLSLIWALTIFGSLYKVYFIGRYKTFSLIMYTLMGWLIIVSLDDMLRLLPMDLIWMLVAGGVFYTAGIVFFQKNSLPFNHAIWHIFVLIGSALHFFGFLWLI